MNLNLKSKTLWAGITGLVGAVAGYFTGTIDPNTAITVGFTSIIGIFIRDGVAKIEGK